MSRTAIGFKAHTGWAAAVVIAEFRGELSVVAKERIVMIEGFDQAAVYHRAHEGNLAADQARPIIEAAFAEALARAEREIARLITDPARAGILTGSARPLPPLEAIIRSHPLVHAAEGEMYREVLSRACKSLGLRAVRVPAKELPKMPAALAAAGVASGRPWAAEQRDCALAAWVALG
jgi:hypothetical protein